MERLGRAILAGVVLVAWAGSAGAQPVCQQQIIKPPSPTFFYNFGMDVAIWGDTVVAGEPTISDFIAGRAHIFDYDEQQGWTHSQMLVPPDGQGGDRFGGSVALLDDWCLVAAHQHSHSKGTGAIYAWKRTNGQWSLGQKVAPPETMFSFGILIGTDRHRETSVDRLWARSNFPFAVHVFSFARGVLEHVQTFDVPAISVAMDRDVLVMGDPFYNLDDCDDPDAGWSGLVFVYRWNGDSWVEEQAPVFPSEAKCGREFGRAVAVYGNTIVATARAPTEAFVFEYDENSATWVHTATVKSPEAGGGFGWRPRSVALIGDTLFIGDETPGGNTGAFVFRRRPDGAWVERAVLRPEGGGSSYGRNVAMHSGRAIVSQSNANQGAGQAYIYDLEPKTGDLNCDGLVNVEDLLILLNAWGECPSTPYPGTDVLPPCNEDLNHDGHVGVQDLLILLQNWGM